MLEVLMWIGGIVGLAFVAVAFCWLVAFMLPPIYLWLPDEEEKEEDDDA